jgi:hypothetical protein
MQPFKIKLNNAQQSAQVQELLFKLGYTWSSGKTEVMFQGCSFLYLNENMKMSAGNDFQKFKQADLPKINYTVFIREAIAEIVAKKVDYQTDIEVAKYLTRNPCQAECDVQPCESCLSYARTHVAQLATPSVFSNHSQQLQ